MERNIGINDKKLKDQFIVKMKTNQIYDKFIKKILKIIKFLFAIKINKIILL